MTKLSKITNYSHDMFTKKLLLDNNLDDDMKLWKSIKPLLRKYENTNDGCIIIDDMLLHKPYTKTNEIVCYHYDHVSNRMAKGILMLNFHYTDSTGISIPLGYEIITKTQDEYSEKYKKNIKKSMFTKNDIMQDKLDILHNHNEVQYKYVLFDKWFASIKNMIFIANKLNKFFVCPLKSNRKVALSKDNKQKGIYVNIADVDIESNSNRLIYLEGFDNPLSLIKQVVKNGNDDEPTYLYLTTNNIDLSFNDILKIYQRRWKVEEYHKSLKQNLKIEHSPTKIEISQRNHIHLSVCSFIKLEKIRLNYKMNHFAIKEKVYIEALRVAYCKVEELMVS